MADRKIQISADFQLDVDKASKSLKDITDKLKGLEKSNFAKQLTDLAKINPVIKEVDKSVGKLLGQFTKSNAKDRIKEINEALKIQAGFLEQLTSKQKEYNDLLKATPKSDPRYQQILNARDDMAGKVRGTARTVEEFGREKHDLKDILKDPTVMDRVFKVAQSTLAVGGGLTAYAASRPLTKMSLEAQANAPGNRLLSMAMNKNDLSFGVLAASGALNLGGYAAKSATSGQLIQKGTGVAQNVLGSAAQGFATGGVGGAITGGGGALSGEVLRNAMLADPSMKEAAKKAMLGANQMQAIDAGLANNQFAIDLMNTIMGQASGKVTAMEAMGGAGGLSGKSLSRRMGKNLGVGAKGGMSLEESLSMMGMVGRGSGLIGGERSDISDMVRYQTGGIATSGEYSQLLSAGASVSATSNRTAKMIKDAVEAGARTGIDKSMVKPLAQAAVQIASERNTRTSDLTGIMSEIRMALGGGTDMRNVGVSELEAAKSGTDLFNSFKQMPMGQAISTMGVEDLLSKGGASPMSVASKLALARAKSSDEIINNPDLMDELRESFGGDHNKINQFLKGFDANTNALPARMLSGMSETAHGLSSPEAIEQLKADLKDPAKAKGAEARLKQMRILMQDLGSTQQTSAAAVNRMLGIEAPEMGGNTNSVVAGTGAQGIKQYQAAIDLNKMAAASEERMAKFMHDAMDATLKASRHISENPMVDFKSGSAQLTTGMSELTQAVYALKSAIDGTPLPEEIRKRNIARGKNIDEHFDAANEAMANMGKPGSSNFVEGGKAAYHGIVGAVKTAINAYTQTVETEGPSPDTTVIGAPADTNPQAMTSTGSR